MELKIPKYNDGNIDSISCAPNSSFLIRKYVPRLMIVDEKKFSVLAVNNLLSFDVVCEFIVADSLIIIVVVADEIGRDD